MSSNVLIHDGRNTPIKQQRNCVDADLNKELNLHYKTKLNDDKCFIDLNTTQSLGPGNYHTSNHFQCECQAPDMVKTATNLPYLFFKNGHDVGGCVVDQSSQLRVGKTRKFPRCPNQLFTRPYKTTPLLARGLHRPHLEDQLQQGEYTRTNRQCGSLSGVHIPHQYTPLLDNVREIQNPVHIVEEVNDPAWTRGGNNTRLLVDDIDFLQRCGYNYMDKEMNNEFWDNKHLYL